MSALDSDNLEVECGHCVDQTSTIGVVDSTIMIYFEKMSGSFQNQTFH